MDVFLIFVCIIMSVMVFIGCGYCLVYFQSEEDNNTAYAPKAAVVFGLWLTCILVLMLPLDVANRNTNGGLPMEELWQTMYVTIAVMCIGIVPFMMFYYEAWDPESRNWQAWTAIKYESVTVLVLGLTLGLMWLFLGYAEVPVDHYHQNKTYSESQLLMPATGAMVCDARCASKAVFGIITLPVTVPVYIMAMVAFLGWWLFTVFVGVGLVALPMDMIHQYATRPEPLNLEDYAKQRMMLHERSQQLQEVATKLGPTAHRKRDTRSIKKFNQFKQAVYFLERDWNRVKTAYKERGGNPLLWMCHGMGGLLSAVLSIFWYIHILLYVFISPPPTTFLNEFFANLDSSFTLFGTAFYALFSFYLLAAVLKGCMKVGLRFLWIPIHPMRIGNTMMNSFLFNVWLLLLCALACVQFCYYSFQSYAQLTAVEMLLGVQVRNLRFLSSFFQNNVFFIMMFCFSGLTTVYLCIWPTDKPAIDDDPIV